MQSTVARWGNSLALRLPKAVAEEAALTVGASVEIVVEEGALRVTPCRKRFNLADLLKGETRATETDWEKPAGGEAW